VSSDDDAPCGPGIRLARSFYGDIVEPLLRRGFAGLRYDAALVGTGSEVLGFDTSRSADHDYGPRLQIFLAADDGNAAEVAALIDAELPAEYDGFPTRFMTGGAALAPGEAAPHQVVITTTPMWSTTALGVDASRHLSAVDWLGMPWQLLAAATGGAVFHSGVGDLERLRATLAWYPDDVWRYVLAGQWTRIEQEEPFVGRTGEVDDDLGSAILTARLVRDVMRMALLLRRRYPPYAKWLGSAFARLPDEPVLGAMLTSALRASDWRDRETHLCHAYEYVATQQNRLGLCAEVDPICRRFWDRPFRVIGGDRFASALRDAVTAPEVRALPLIGSIDQIADSTDVLSHADRCAALNRSLFAS
jgi:hypothetical protein